jgi:type IV secretory pathway VirB6-like protein
VEFFKKLLTKKFLIIFFLVGFFVATIYLGGEMPEEIKPGDGFSQSSIGVDIKANRDTWTDSGVSLSSDIEDFKFTVSGSIFLCSGNAGGQSVPYQKEVVLVGANNSDYTNTKISVSNGDFIKFNLVPIVKKIDNCGTISSNLDFSFDKDDTFYNKNGSKIKASDVCRGDDFYTTNSKDDKDKIPGIPYLTSEYKKNISNDEHFEIDGNKWRRGAGANLWFKGSFMDLRLKIDDDDKIEKLSCPSSGGSLDPRLAKFESQVINEKCSKFARQGGSVFSFYQKMNGADYAVDSDGQRIDLAEGLVAATLDNANNSTQCFPTALSVSDCKGGVNYSGADSIEKYSLRINYQYKVDNPAVLNQQLFLGIADTAANYSTNVGGYNVEVMRSCVKEDGEGLYLYIGDSAPQDFTDAIDMSGKVKDGIYTIKNAGSSGKLFFKIKDNMDGPNGAENYGNNSGNYHLAFRVNASPTWISEIASRIVDPLRSLIFTKQVLLSTGEYIESGASFDLYHGIMDSGLRNIIRALLVLFVAIIGIGFTLGILELKSNDLFMIAFKVGAVSILLTDRSWYFLNKYFLNIFWYGPDVLISKFTGFYNELSTVKYNASFGFLDKTLGTLFQWENLTKWLSLLPYSITNPLSLFLFIMLFWSFWDIIQASIKGVVLYSVCIVINGFLVGLAPIFFCFMLFKITFRFFDSWIKQLIGNMMTVVLYFIIIGMLNEVIYNLMYQIFNFGAYKECMIPISIGTWKVCLVNFPMPFVGSALANFASNGASSAENIANMLPISIPVIITFKIFTKCYHIMVDVVNVLPSSIFGGSMMYSALDIASGASQGALYGIGMDDASIKRRHNASKGLKKAQKRPKLKHDDYAPKVSLSTDSSSGSSGSSGAGVTPASSVSTSRSNSTSTVSSAPVSTNADIQISDKPASVQPDVDNTTKIDLSTKEMNQYDDGIVKNPYEFDPSIIYDDTRKVGADGEIVHLGRDHPDHPEYSKDAGNRGEKVGRSGLLNNKVGDDE